MPRMCCEGVGERRRMPARRVSVLGLILCSISFSTFLFWNLRFEI